MAPPHQRRNSKPPSASIVDYKKLNLQRDALCPICNTILIEPITLPCAHSFCSVCFDETILHGTANLVCALCKIRIRSWLRSATRSGASSRILINEPLWTAIRALFPSQVRNKLNDGGGGGGSTINKDNERVIGNDEVVADTTDLAIASTSKENRSSCSSSNVLLSQSSSRSNKINSLDNYKRNETLHICKNQDYSNSCQQPPPPSMLIAAKNKQIQKVIESSDVDDSSDSIESECIYFKPIDYRHNPPSQRRRIPIIKVPTRRPTAMNAVAKITPPTGRNQINLHRLVTTSIHHHSAFVRLLNNNKSSLFVDDNDNNNKRKHVNNTSSSNVLIGKKLKVMIDDDKEDKGSKRFCDIENDSLSLFKKLTDESVKKILQEKADFEYARRLQDEFNQMNKYSTRSRYSKRVASAKIQVMTK